MRKLYILGLIGLMCVIFGLAWAEEITLTTYYPAPFGVYKDFETTENTHLATTTSGSVGIGTVNPNYKFHVHDAGGNVLVQLTQQSTGENVNDGFIIGFDGSQRATLTNGENTDMVLATNSSVRVTIKNDGNVGIGVDDPAHLIELAGGAYCDGSGDWITGSSREFKKDIQPLSIEECAEIVEKLKNVEVVRYRYKNLREDQRLRIGVIAEDAPEEFATSDKKGVSPLDAIGFLLAAVKGQQEQIQSLEKEIHRLKRRVH